MKKIILASIFLAAAHAHGQTTGQSRFHLLDMKCEKSELADFEGTPQSPPLDVDDPGTPGCNNWEINVLVSGDITKNQKDWKIPLLDLNYGVGNNLQLKFEVPYLQNETEGSSLSATGSSRAGIKWLFYSDDDSKLQAGFYPQMEFAAGSKDAIDKGLEQPGNIIALPLLVSKRILARPSGDVMLTLNVSYNASSKRDVKDFGAAAIGVGVPILPSMAVMGEISTEQSLVRDDEGIREQLVKINFGGLLRIANGFMFYTSLGKSLSSSDDLDHNYLLAGIRILPDAFSN